ncbi:hypothetical protein [Leucobacter soli]|uniref:hypothetical protein n=1 Tax=Leucobacter soli TaxID=2812850 RepID=UPI0036062C17
MGLITAELQKSAERAAEIREETSALAQELIDAGGQLDAEAIAAKVHEWSLEVQDNKEWWELWQESAVTNLDKVNDIAGKTGVNMRDLFDAMSGQDSTKALDMLDDMQGRADELDRQLAQLSQARAGGTKRAQELRTERDALNDGTKAIRERLDIQEGAEDDYRQLTALTAELTAEAEAATAAEEAHTDAVGALQRGLDSAVGSWTDYIDKETQAADPEAYLKGMRERMEATVSFNDNVQQLADDFGLTQDEVQAILDQGIDFAPMLQAIIDGGPKMQEKYAEQMRAMLDGGEAILDGQEISATVTTKADTKDAARDLDKTATQKRTARIGTKADTKDAGREIDTVAEKDRTATVKVELDWTDADREMQAFLTKTRNVTVDVQTRAGKRTP